MPRMISDDELGSFSPARLSKHHVGHREDSLPTTPTTLGKRRRSHDDASPSPDEMHPTEQDHAPVGRIGLVRPYGLTVPKSLFEGWEPPFPPSSEKSIFTESPPWQTYATLTKDSLGCFEAELSDFTIYRPKVAGSDPWTNYHYDLEMESLDALTLARGCDSFLFDGVLTVGNERYYLQAVRFEILSIDGYEDPCSTIRDRIYIQSYLGKRNNMWYRLATPSPEYRRYHEPFLWVADLSKHFINYMEDHERVCLDDFRVDFFEWLSSRHSQDSAFKQWHSQYGHVDYRNQLVANVKFLWKEANGVFTGKSFTKEPLWKDLNHHSEGAVKEQPRQTAKTIVTPRVAKSFKHSGFAENLDPQVPKSPEIIDAQRQRQASLGFVSRALMHSEPAGIPKLSIEVGDVVAVRRDEDGPWKDKAPIWFAYVQEIKKDARGQPDRDRLIILWLYRKEDTTLGDARYSQRNELFLSDHCNCSDESLKRGDVVRKLTVQWFVFEEKDKWSRRENKFEYLIRLVYKTDNEEHGFVTLHKDSFACTCRSKPQNDTRKTYGKGDSVWIRPHASAKESLLQPAIIDWFLPDERVAVRRLLGGNRDHGRANELVWTDEIYEVSCRRIERKMHLRFYSQEDISEGRVPAPYNRNGTADCCYIMSNPSDPVQKSLLNQGFDPLQPPTRQPLKGLEMFAGSGGFGRGLQEGGAVKMLYAIDWDRHAVHSYRANHKNHLYYGSVNDYLYNAFRGNKSELIAPIGSVDFIAAGSPCQAFSLMNRFGGTTEVGRQNASMVAAVASYIDFYRPKYAILENVSTMAAKREGSVGPSVFTQFLATLVSMGYQVQQFRLDAWSSGDPQSRSRLFISITAPGLTPQRHPSLTHDHPPDTRAASLGTNVNNERFGKRLFQTPAFPCPQAAESTKDLPFLGDARVGLCIPFPDHRNVQFQRHMKRQMISQIPRHPTKQGAVQATASGALPSSIIDRLTRSFTQTQLRSTSHAWTRCDGLRLMPTIKTAANPGDGIGGKMVHWDEHRVLTFMEARRAQGVPDDVVIVGNPVAQWKQIGNAVAYSTAVALGMSLREAWLANRTDGVVDLGDEDGEEDETDEDELSAINVSNLGSRVDQDIEEYDEALEGAVVRAPSPDRGSSASDSADVLGEIVVPVPENWRMSGRGGFNGFVKIEKKC